MYFPHTRKGVKIRIVELLLIRCLHCLYEHSMAPSARIISLLCSYRRKVWSELGSRLIGHISSNENASNRLASKIQDKF